MFVPSAAAQEDSKKTPREQILQDLNLVDNVLSEPEQRPNKKTETIKGLRGSTPEKSSLKILLDAISAEIAKPKKPIKIERTIAPFYLSAQDYLTMRGHEASDQMVLHYEVTNGAATGKGLGTVKQVQLILGKKFAAMQVDKNLTIYDFKLDRILTVNPEYNMDGKTTGKLLFENTSLYAKVYRDITAVRSVTNNGQLKTLDLGQGTSLDAFWVESSMSWAGKKAQTALAIKKTGNSLKIKREDEIILSAEFSDEKYKDDNTKNSLFAFAHHEWPLHPSVLRELYTQAAPPTKFEMLAYGPSAPKGQKQVWTLIERKHINAEFPLPSKAISSSQRQQVSPLVFLIDEAVHNRALAGIQSVNEMTQIFNTNMDKAAFGQAWVLGQKYMAYSGNCKNPDDLTICDAVANLEQSQKDAFPKPIQDYIKAMSLVRSKGKNAEAVAILAPYLDKKETPAFIIRTAAMARAKMKKMNARKAGVETLNAESLLQISLAKDPYDPNTYVGLGQVLAANGALEQSWDIYDALRAGIPTSDSLEVKITRLEDNLRRTAPGYFLQQ